jgi:hypothetical protein
VLYWVTGAKGFAATLLLEMKAFHAVTGVSMLDAQDYSLQRTCCDPFRSA